jgi:hypothetical protein
MIRLDFMSRTLLQKTSEQTFAKSIPLRVHRRRAQGHSGHASSLVPHLSEDGTGVWHRQSSIQRHEMRDFARMKA